MCGDGDKNEHIVIVDDGKGIRVSWCTFTSVWASVCTRKGSRKRVYAYSVSSNLEGIVPEFVCTEDSMGVNKHYASVARARGDV